MGSHSKIKVLGNLSGPVPVLTALGLGLEVQTTNALAVPAVPGNCFLRVNRFCVTTELPLYLPRPRQNVQIYLGSHAHANCPPDPAGLQSPGWFG